MAILGRTLYSPTNFMRAKAVAHTVAQLYCVFCVGKSCSFVNDSHYIWTWHLAEVNSYQQSSSS